LNCPVAFAKSGQNSFEMITDSPSYSIDALTASMVFFNLKGLTT